MKTNKAGKDSLNTIGINTLHMFPLVISEMRLVKTVQSLPSLGTPDEEDQDLSQLG